MQRLAGAFVPAADEVGALQRSAGAEGRFFRNFSERGHNAREPRSVTRQGIYAITPSARLLASVNSRNPREVAAMLQQALEAWERLAPEQRRLGDGMRRALGWVRRWRHLYPSDGLVLGTTSRDLEVGESIRDWRAGAWNHDWAWFTRDEARSFVPDGAAPGTRRDVPRTLVARLVRAHLVDNVRGTTWPFPADAVARAELTTEVVGAQGDLVELRLTGATRAEQAGVWSVASDREPAAQRRGVETRLEGTASWDRARQRFAAFELVAAGRRWGGTTHNQRGDDLEPTRIGFVFRLADPADEQRVTPSLFWVYGWEPGWRPAGPMPRWR